MRVYADKLGEQLARQLQAVYVLTGAELLLLQESRQAIIKKAQSEGFDERHHFTLDAQLDWNQVFDCTQALSLFSSRQIIELEIGESGLPAGATKELQALSESLHADIVLILIGQKLTKAQENAKWFKALTTSGTVVSCLTPDIKRLPQFVMQRCRKLKLSPDSQAVQMLAQWHEGNLLALVQSLEKLALLYPDGELTLVRVEEALSRHNHYTPFQWVDALLAGQTKRSQRILRQLQAEGVEAIILLRSVQKELMQLLAMQREMQTKPIGAVMESFRVWQNKRPLYNAALQRLSPVQLARLIHLLTAAELEAKTQYDSGVWTTLAQLSLECCAHDALISKLN
ncbi:DNA polymerase III subunit delta [Vibrio sp. SCSIO 43136]|uniref:DNA polymerase III subunit delta n=1 Tax=Vibrio sp. SCSIO 43136 TaxID=2819101 RepID=UPI002074CE28|nr:DNA polymerase III subunit delta [Vibrio sp. SCSIO 43136]USD64657.1 DNA polymerase III subunit delta [Vibrio sp. SCSIO 43136]